MNHILDDALHLMQKFYEPIQQGAAHIYVSAIPFTPSTSILFQIYAPKLQNIPKLISGSTISTALLDLHCTAAAFSPDASWFVCAGNNKKLSIWHAADHIPICEALTGHSAKISAIKFSSDGSKFYSVDESCLVLIWDAMTYRAIGIPIQLSAPMITSISADKFIGYNKPTCQVFIWEVMNGNLVVTYKLEGSWLADTHFLQDNYLGFGSSQTGFQIIDLISRDDITTKFSHGQSIMKPMQFSPDGSKVACMHDDMVIRILDVFSGNVIGNPIGPIQTNNMVFCKFGFLAKGKIFVWLVDGITCHNINSEEVEYVPLRKGFSKWGSNSVALSSDGTHLVVCKFAELEVLHIKSGKTVGTLSPFFHSANAECVLSHSNHIIAYDCLSNSIRLFDVSSLSANHYDGHVQFVTPSPTGSQLLVTLHNNSLRLLLQPSFTSVILDRACTPAVFSSDGFIILSACMDNSLQVWDSKDGSCIGNALQGHLKPVTAVAFSPTGNYLISASRDCTICIWAAAGAEELQKLQSFGNVRAISLSLDESTIICASRKGDIWTMNAVTGLVISYPMTYDWHCAKFLPDANMIICVSKSGQICSIDAQTGQITKHSKLHCTGEFGNFHFSPNTMHLLSVSKSNSVTFTDIATSDVLSLNSYSPSTQSLTFSPNGSWMISVHTTMVPGSFHDKRHVCMWDVPSGLLVWETTLAVVRSQNAKSLVAISHSSEMVVICDWQVCRVMSALLGTTIKCFRSKLSPYDIRSTTFSLDDSQIYTEAISDYPECRKTVEMWDIESGTSKIVSSTIIDTPVIKSGVS